MFWNRQPQVGIDIGSYSLKSCCFEGSHKRCSVHSAPLRPLRQAGAAARLAGSAARLPEQFLNNRKNRHVGLALDDPSVMAGYLEFPALSPSELKFAIPSAVVRESPFPLSELRLFHEQVPALRKSSDKIGVFYVTVPEKVIGQKIAICSDLGLEVKTSEPALIAQLRGLSRNHQLAVGETVALISVGSQSTSLLLSRDGHPYYYRSFRLAGEEFTRLFQAAGQTSWEEAEMRKFDYDVTSRRSFFVEPAIMRWLRQIRLSLEDAASRFPELKPTQVLLTGGTACWNGLCDRLAEELCLAIKMEHWERFQPDSVAQSTCLLSTFDVALGMALKR